MGSAQVIALSDVRASMQWQRLRDQLHARFDQWLDQLQEQLPEPQTSLSAITTAVWPLRQALTGSLSETIVEQAHTTERTRRHVACPGCGRCLTARPAGSRTVDTMVGPVHVERPYFYCTAGCSGVYPLDAALDVAPGRKQLDVQQAAARMAIELPYEEAQTVCSELPGVELGSECLHTFTNQAAEGLTVLDVAPSREDIARCIQEVAAGRFRRPIVVLGIDGASVPTRPESARGRRPGQGATGLSGRSGKAGGAIPRAFGFISLMTIALCICSGGIRCTMRHNWARRFSR